MLKLARLFLGFLRFYPSLVAKGLRNERICEKNIDPTDSEDVNMALCLERLGVTIGDSRDFDGKQRFFPFVVNHHLIHGYLLEGIHSYDFHPTDEVSSFKCIYFHDLRYIKLLF